MILIKRGTYLILLSLFFSCSNFITKDSTVFHITNSSSYISTDISVELSTNRSISKSHSNIYPGESDDLIVEVGESEIDGVFILNYSMNGNQYKTETTRSHSDSRGYTEYHLVITNDGIISW